jgi:hypothetical protein
MSMSRNEPNRNLVNDGRDMDPTETDGKYEPVRWLTATTGSSPAPRTTPANDLMLLVVCSYLTRATTRMVLTKAEWIGRLFGRFCFCGPQNDTHLPHGTIAAGLSTNQ